MPKKKKFSSPKNLQNFSVLVEDTSDKSRYFRLSQVPDTLTAGKNAFLINGSDLLEPTTTVKVEVTDSEGGVIFSHPIKNYQEGLARVVSIEVYDDTPVGPGTITVMGEARRLANGDPVPDEWRGRYNVRWSTNVSVQPTSVNTSKVRLYARPVMEIDEILVNHTEPQEVIERTLEGTARYFRRQEVSSTETRLNHVLDRIDFGEPLTSEMEGAEVIVTGPDINLTTTVKRVINHNTLILEDGVSVSRQDVDVELVYTPEPEFIETLLTRSFADIKLSKLTTFSGDVDRAKFYVKTDDTSSEFELIDDITLDSVELFTTLSLDTAQTDLRYGFFTEQGIVDDYWESGTVSTISGYFEESFVEISKDDTRLMDSVTITEPSNLASSPSTEPQYYISTIEPVNFFQDLEYTLSLNAFCVKSEDDFVARCDVYAEGDAFSDRNPLGKLIHTFESGTGTRAQWFDDVEINFTAKRDGTARIFFVIHSGEWHFSRVGLESSAAFGFNPDETETLVPIYNKRFEPLIFKVELFNPNNDLIPIEIISDRLDFDGENVYILGGNNYLGGTVTIGGDDPETEVPKIKLTNQGFSGPSGMSEDSPAIYIGEGNWGNADTPFLIGDSEEDGPVFSVADNLTYHDGVLNINADLNVSGTGNVQPRSFQYNLVDLIRNSETQYEVVIFANDTLNEVDPYPSVTIDSFVNASGSSTPFDVTPGSVTNSVIARFLVNIPSPGAPSALTIKIRGNAPLPRAVDTLTITLPTGDVTDAFGSGLWQMIGFDESVSTTNSDVFESVKTLLLPSNFTWDNYAEVMVLYTVGRTDDGPSSESEFQLYMGTSSDDEEIGNVLALPDTDDFIARQVKKVITPRPLTGWSGEDGKLGGFIMSYAPGEIEMGEFNSDILPSMDRFSIFARRSGGDSSVNVNVSDMYVYGLLKPSGTTTTTTTTTSTTTTTTTCPPSNTFLRCEGADAVYSDGTCGEYVCLDNFNCGGSRYNCVETTTTTTSTTTTSTTTTSTTTTMPPGSENQPWGDEFIVLESDSFDDDTIVVPPDEEEFNYEDGFVVIEGDDFTDDPIGTSDSFTESESLLSDDSWNRTTDVFPTSSFNWGDSGVLEESESVSDDPQTTDPPPPSVLLSYNQNGQFDACNDTDTESYYYDELDALSCEPLGMGCVLYTGPSLETPAPDGFYSDGDLWYQIDGGMGEIVDDGPCVL